MVPHSNILRLIALTSLARTDSSDYVDKKCKEFHVRFPGDATHVLMTEVYPSIGLAHQAYLTTSDPATQKDFSVLVDAARQLGLERFITITAEGPDIELSDDLMFWRTESQLRIFIETSLLCGVSVAQVEEDIRKVWGFGLDSSQLEEFKMLFADPRYVRGDSWVMYERCVPPDESIFKKRLLNAPHDYVRHSLGVPVTLDANKVLDRLISDAHYTEQSLKHQLSDPDHMTNDMLKRVKLERDTLIKALDRKIKLQQYEHEKGSSGGSDIVRDTLSRIEVEYKDSTQNNSDSPLLSDLNGGDDVEADD